LLGHDGRGLNAQGFDGQVRSGTTFARVHARLPQTGTVPHLSIGHRLCGD
jgi:hypothetical protein